MTVKNLIAATALALLLAASNIAFAGPLDQPANKQLTVGSELKRGGVVAFNCWKNNYDSIYATTSAITDAIAAEQTANTDTDAFYAGLYLKAWSSMAVTTADKKTIGTMYTAREFNYGVEMADFYFKQYLEYRQKLNITDDDVCKALEVINCSKLKAKIDEWSKK